MQSEDHTSSAAAAANPPLAKRRISSSTGSTASEVRRKHEEAERKRRQADELERQRAESIANAHTIASFVDIVVTQCEASRRKPQEYSARPTVSEITGYSVFGDANGVTGSAVAQGTHAQTEDESYEQFEARIASANQYHHQQRQQQQQQQ